MFVYLCTAVQVEEYLQYTCTIHPEWTIHGCKLMKSTQTYTQSLQKLIQKHKHEVAKKKQVTKVYIHKKKFHGVGC